MVNLLLTIATLAASSRALRPGVMPGDSGWKSSRQDLWDKVWPASNPVCAEMIEGGCKDTAALLRGESEGGEEAMEVEKNQ